MIFQKNNIMKILVASGAFKDVFTPAEACIMIGDILEDIFDNRIIVDLLPMVDGGEYSCDVLSDYCGYSKKTIADVADSVGNICDVEYLLLNDKTAFIATSSVLALSSKYGDEKRNPLLLTSYGFGQMIKYIYDQEVRNIVIGFGGTSTVDAGIGMLQALGARGYDKNGEVMRPVNGIYYTGADLQNVANIDCTELREQYSDLKIKALCDTSIGLNKIDVPTSLKVGKYYKDDRLEIVSVLLDALFTFSDMLEKNLILENVLNKWPGGNKLIDKNFFGVAGGILLGMCAVFNIVPVMGVEYFIDLFDLETKIKGADIVISGEGRFDISVEGKTPVGVALVAKMNQKPAICLCGTVNDSLKESFDLYESTTLPDNIQNVGLSKIISCHAGYDDFKTANTYQEEIEYYRKKTPEVLRKALRKFFNKSFKDD